MKPRIAILISGGGSNMISLIKAIKSNEINALPAIVISNNSNAAGLTKPQNSIFQLDTSIIENFLEIERHLKSVFIIYYKMKKLI
jgi:folate-dependent phosphoribosylglycinamide formyltransferase PurN